MAGCATKEVADLSIINVRVVDAETTDATQKTVTISNGVISYVGEGANAPDAKTTINGEGKYLIPGLWDMHVHLTYDERFTNTMPAQFVRYGITSIRDTGGLLALLLPVVEKMRAPGALAPRVYFSGPLLDGDHVVYDGNDVPEIGTTNTDPDQAAAAVAALAEAGASFIKIYEMVSPEVFEALVAAANAKGLPIAAHVPLSMHADKAAPAVDSMEHLRNIELACIQEADNRLSERRAMLENPDKVSGNRLRQSIHGAQRDAAIDAFDPDVCGGVLGALRETIQVPTLRLNAINQFIPFDRTDWQDALTTLPDDVRQQWTKRPSWLGGRINQSFFRYGQFSLDMIPRLIEAGVPIGAGTDTPIAYAIPGYSLHNELETLVAAGLSERDALAAATTVPARFFGLENQIGLIKVGMLADLVLLDKNPLEDIKHTKKISTVVLRGEVVR